MKRFLPIAVVVILIANSAFAGQGDQITPGENLVTEGIPKIPAALARDVNRYKNNYGYPLAGWDMSKHEIWLKALSSMGTWISRIDTPGSIPKPLISIPTGGVYDVYYQPQDNAQHQPRT